MKTLETQKYKLMVCNRNGFFPIRDESENDYDEETMRVLRQHGDFLKTDDGTLWRVRGDGSAEILR